MSSCVVSFNSPQDFLTSTCPVWLKTATLTPFSLASISTVAFKPEDCACCAHRNVDMLSEVALYKLPQRKRDTHRAACVKLFQTLQGIRNKKMLKEFNMEVACSLCRYLADLVCAHINTAPIQMVNVLHLCSTFLVLWPLKCFTPQVTLTPFIYWWRGLSRKVRSRPSRKTAHSHTFTHQWHRHWNS